MAECQSSTLSCLQVDVDNLSFSPAFAWSTLTFDLLFNAICHQDAVFQPQDLNQITQRRGYEVNTHLLRFEVKGQGHRGQIVK